MVAILRYSTLTFLFAMCPIAQSCHMVAVIVATAVHAINAGMVKTEEALRTLASRPSDAIAPADYLSPKPS